MNENQPCEHRRFQFSLRTLLMAVAAVCVFVAYPRYIGGVAALFISVSLVGSLFAILVYLPIQNLLHPSTDQKKLDTNP